MPDAAVPFSTVLRAELDQIKRRQQKLGITRFTWTQWKNADAHQLRTLGVAFSGGGIRSATFNLGVIQGLSEIGLLPFIDYLSTVSGGGYIGAWLHGLVARRAGGNPGLGQMALHPVRNAVPEPPNLDPVAFLRKYSNYLAPEVGLFSPDFWVIAAVWLRNLLLNLLILIPFLALVVAFILAAGVLQFPKGPQHPSILLVPGVAMLAAVCIIGRNLAYIVKRVGQDTRTKAPLPAAAGRWDSNAMTWLVTLLVLASSYVLGARGISFYRWQALVPLWILFVLLQNIGGFSKCYRSRRRHRRRTQLSEGVLFLHYLWMPLVSAVVTAWLLHITQGWIAQWKTEAFWNTITFGPPMVTAVWFCGVVVHIGLMGADYPDAAREFLARLASLITIQMAAWMALFGLSAFGPLFVAWLLVVKLPAGIAAAGAWLSSALGGYLAGQSKETDGTETAAGPVSTKLRALSFAAKVAPTAFMVGLLLLVSFGVHLLVRAMVSPGPACRLYYPMPPGGWLGWAVPVYGQFWCIMNQPSNALLGAAAWIGGVCLLLVVILPLRFNINEFSLHHFYKNRLVRCYLGATASVPGQHRTARQPNRQTGFDPQDDFPIESLRPGKGYFGPYPIVNCTLNLNTGSELSQQERKACSFVFTPVYSGFETVVSEADTARSRCRLPWFVPRSAPVKVRDWAIRWFAMDLDGYRPTDRYMQAGGPRLGTVTAISGAAANPNAGFHTSAPLAFLLTILDVRLGWWVGNPRKAGPSATPGPLNALVSLLSELFAQTNARSRYVNLSDGGHFENLGLYELVRRRCRYIIVADSEEDPSLTFGSLGAAIRKCRADFGVEITLDPQPISRAGGFSKTHCVVGRIIYPEPETGVPATMDGGPREDDPYHRARGWLLYLKSSLTGDEPEDVRQYHCDHPAFPHDSTSDQFFSESQFESYRELGLHVVKSAFENVDEHPAQGDWQGMLKMFQDLSRKWYPTPELESADANRLTAAYSAVMEKIGMDPDVRGLDASLFPGPPVSPINRKEFYYCVELLQLMEDVFFDLNLESRANRENPNYAGWVSLFRAWVNSPPIDYAWNIIQPAFSPIFQKFYRNLQGGVY